MAGPSPYRIDWSIDDSLSPRGRAVAIALVLMQRARVTTWSEYADLLRSDTPEGRNALRGANLSVDDCRLLDAHETTLRGLRLKDPPKSLKSVAAPSTTIVECPVCRRWGYAAKVAPAKKCGFTRHCEGNPVKVSPADHSFMAA